MKVLHFGAGNIGRGFIGKVLAYEGYELYLVDVNDKIINQINETGSYKVRYINEAKDEFKINNVKALNSQTELENVIKILSTVDLITTSVGVDNLGRLVPTLVEGLLKHKNEVDIICNENAINATSILKQQIKAYVKENKIDLNLDKVGFLNSAIDRQAMNEIVDGEDIAVVEPFFEWIIEDVNIKNENNKKLSSVIYVTDIAPYIERKLFIVNSEHAISAYLGSLYGLNTIQDVLSTEKYNLFLRKVLSEHAKYLEVEYGMMNLSQYIDKTLERHGSPLLADDIHRVGRNPIRKLSSNERIVGPLMKLIEHNLPYENTLESVAIAYKYRNQDDPEAIELAKVIKTSGIKNAIAEISSITDLEVINKISEIYNNLEAEDVDWKIKRKYAIWSRSC